MDTLAADDLPCRNNPSSHSDRSKASPTGGEALFSTFTNVPDPSKAHVVEARNNAIIKRTFRLVAAYKNRTATFTRGLEQSMILSIKDRRLTDVFWRILQRNAINKDAKLVSLIPSSYDRLMGKARCLAIKAPRRGPRVVAGSANGVAARHRSCRIDAPQRHVGPSLPLYVPHFPCLPHDPHFSILRDWNQSLASRCPPSPSLFRGRKGPGGKYRGVERSMSASARTDKTTCTL